MAHRQRDLADEMATRYGCDDPLRPATAGRELRDWRDLFEGARPVVERADDDGDYQADASVRMVSPYTCAQRWRCGQRAGDRSEHAKTPGRFPTGVVSS